MHAYVHLYVYVYTYIPMFLHDASLNSLMFLALAAVCICLPQLTKPSPALSGWRCRTGGFPATRFIAGLWASGGSTGQPVGCGSRAQIYMHTCMYVSIYLSIYLSMYLCIYVSMYSCVYVSMYLCIYVSMYLCMYACMHVCR